MRAVVEYDGTDFAGWQRQSGRRTVSRAIEEALGRVTGEEARIIGAGRTDAGVHATGQVAHFDTRWTGETAELLRALNAVLPSDVALRALDAAPDGFHARHSAIGREYRYAIWNAAQRSPMARRTTFAVDRPLDEGRMAKAAAHLVGVHDFAAFGKPMTPGGPTVRNVERAEVVRTGATVEILLASNAFLRHQVRRTIGFLVAVGLGRLEPDFAIALVGGATSGRDTWRAPAHGLILTRVIYPSDELIAASGRTHPPEPAVRDVEK